MLLAVALLALTITFVSGSPMSTTSELSSAVLNHSDNLDTIKLPAAPTPAQFGNQVGTRVVHQSAPQETGGDGTIYIAKDETEVVQPRQQGPIGCIIYIARDEEVGSKDLQNSCPPPTVQKVRRLPLPSYKTKSSMFRVEDHFPGYRYAEHDVEHKQTPTTLVSPGLTTLTVSASTGREPGGVIVITGPVTHESHKTHSSKTKSWVSPGTFTVTGGSGTFTVITTALAHPEHTHLAGRIPPPEWLSTHVKTHVRPTNEPVFTETRLSAGRVPPPEWLSTHTRNHPYTGRMLAQPKSHLFGEAQRRAYPQPTSIQWTCTLIAGSTRLRQIWIQPMFVRLTSQLLGVWEPALRIRHTSVQQTSLLVGV